MKKAQVQQIFIFVFILIVVSLTIVFGYKYIKQITKGGEEISITMFQQELEKRIKAVSQNYGEVDIVEFELATKHENLCFVDSSYFEEGAEDIQTDYPLIDISVNSGVKDNVFIGKEAKPLEVSSLEIENGFLCINNTHGKIKLKIEGLGTKAKIDYIK